MKTISISYSDYFTLIAQLWMMTGVICLSIGNGINFLLCLIIATFNLMILILIKLLRLRE